MPQRALHLAEHCLTVPGDACRTAENGSRFGSHLPVTRYGRPRFPVSMCGSSKLAGMLSLVGDFRWGVGVTKRAGVLPGSRGRRCRGRVAVSWEPAAARSWSCDRLHYLSEVALARVDPVNTALVVALISGVVALASVGLSAWTQLQVTKRERQRRAEERRSDAKVVLDRYRGPLLDAAWQLGDRLDSIRHRGFLAYLCEGSGRERDAKLTALFRFAHYFGLREFVRTEVQLLRFENEEDTRSAAGFLDDVAEVLASDLLDGKWAMLWNDEQRGIGELMTERPSGASSIVRGHAAFHRDYDKTFAPWMERFAGDLLSSAALKSDRLRLLQWALYGLVRQLDEEGTYGGVWIDRSASEICRPAQHGSFTQHEEKLRRHLAAIEPSTSSLRT